MVALPWFLVIQVSAFSDQLSAFTRDQPVREAQCRARQLPVRDGRNVHQTPTRAHALQCRLVLHSAKSINGITIRLTDERWLHITEAHSELAGYLYEVLEAIECPGVIYQGGAGELLAARQVEPGKYLVVVYREQASEGGFVITAFLTRRLRQIERRKRVWPR